jgi:hypothetical protein
MSDTMQLVTLSVGTLSLFALIVSILLWERHVRETGPNSAHFSKAGASTSLCKKIAHLIGPGVEILMPAGAGHYPLTLTGAQRQRWIQHIEEWLARGARLTIIISMPDTRGIEFWQPIIDRLSPQLRVCLLDRKLASADDAIEIPRIDTFHPTLVVKGSEPLAMWIESSHIQDSSVAYNVQFVAKEDIVKDQRIRFDRFLAVLRRLTDRGHEPLHLRELLPSKKTDARQKTDALIAA